MRAGVRFGRPSSVATLAVVLAVLTVASVAVGWYMWQSYNQLQGSQARNLQLQELTGEIAHLDEVLTMSARMGAATADQRWEARYADFEPRLSSVIEEARRLAPSAFGGKGAAQTDSANVALVDMEHRAFDLIRDGELEAAMSVLDSPEYEEQKIIYSEGNEQLAASLLESGAASVSSSKLRWSVAIIAEGLLLLVVILFAVLMSISTRERVRA